MSAETTRQTCACNPCRCNPCLCGNPANRSPSCECGSTCECGATCGCASAASASVVS